MNRAEKNFSELSTNEDCCLWVDHELIKWQILRRATSLSLPLPPSLSLSFSLSLSLSLPLFGLRTLCLLPSGSHFGSKIRFEVYWPGRHNLNSKFPANQSWKRSGIFHTHQTQSTFSRLVCWEFGVMSAWSVSFKLYLGGRGSLSKRIRTIILFQDWFAGNLQFRSLFLSLSISFSCLYLILRYLLLLPN